MLAEKTQSLRTSEILVNEIVFYSRFEISLLGFVHLGGKYIETEYLISRNELQMLLSQNGNTGIEILWQIEQLFVLPHEVPAAINLVERYGTTQELKAERISLHAPRLQPENRGTADEKAYELLVVETVHTAPGTRPSYFTV